MHCSSLPIDKVTSSIERACKKVEGKIDRLRAQLGTIGGNNLRDRAGTVVSGLEVLLSELAAASLASHASDLSALCGTSGESTEVTSGEMRLSLGGGRNRGKGLGPRRRLSFLSSGYDNLAIDAGLEEDASNLDIWRVRQITGRNWTSLARTPSPTANLSLRASSLAQIPLLG